MVAQNMLHSSVEGYLDLLIYSRHLFVLTVVQSKYISQRTVFLYTGATCSELPFYESTMLML